MYLGIDLGTSNSAIVGSVDGVTRLFKTADGTDVLPSVIYLNKRNQHRIVGTRAYHHSFTAPEDTAHGFKRHMGTSSPIRFVGAGVSWTAEECSAEILRTLISQARIEAGDFTVDGAVVTIPAAFNQMQSEATLRAAEMAGLERVSLLQEPVAAAMASVTNSKEQNGIFLVYDIGGGTFDVALVQSVRGAVTVLAHEGINMLGGRDFDRLVLDAHVRPWLQDNFALPADFQRDPSYHRLLGIARSAVEKARIDLSTLDATTIHAEDADLRLTDTVGGEMYLSVPLRRIDVEVLIEDKVGDTIALCRKMLHQNGLSADDVSRVVLIGGPSKMPLIRTEVPRQLGIEAEQGLDPMTAVATGAAIFAAGREWTKEGTRTKAAKRSETSQGALQITCEFPASVSDERTRLYVKVAGSPPVGHTIEVTDLDGVNYGKANLETGLKFDLRLPKLGSNIFRVTVTDAAGQLVLSACRELMIERQGATAAGIPMTYTLAVKVQEGVVGQERNVLKTLVAKGTMLPAQGETSVRAANAMRGGDDSALRMEFFQQKVELPDPLLALSIGEFRLDARRHLDPGERIQRGQEVKLLWKINENGLLRLSVEVPDLGRVIDASDFYLSEAGHENYEGSEGAELASALLNEASAEIESAEDVLDSATRSEMTRLRQRLEEQHKALSASVDAETHRLAAEEARLVRQEIALLQHRPEAREPVLRKQLLDSEAMFEQFRPVADTQETDRFDRLSGTAQRAMRLGDFDALERALTEMERLRFGIMVRDFEFLLHFAASLAQERFAARDKALHDRHVVELDRVVQRRDVAALRVIIGAFLSNRAVGGGRSTEIAQLADLFS